MSILPGSLEEEPDKIFDQEFQRPIDPKVKCVFALFSLRKSKDDTS
jgi:hypothetical protein